MRVGPIACLAAGVLAALAAVPAQAESLREALSVLLVENPQILAARNNALAADAAIAEARAAFLPRAELSGDTGYENTDSPERRNAGLDSFSMRRDKLTLTVTQNLFSGFRDVASVDVARRGALAAETALAATRQAVLFEGASAYLDVLRNYRLIEVSRRNEATIQSQLLLEDERVQRGSGITVDVLQAKSRLQVAKEQRVAFEGRFRAALARYKQVFGYLPDVARMEDARAPESLLPTTLEDAIAASQRYNPQLLVTRLQSEIARAQVRIAGWEYYPIVDLVGTVDYEDNVSTTRGIEREHSVLVRARWEFFSGFRTRARVRGATQTFAASRDNVNFATRKVEEEVRLAWEQLLTERRRVDLLDNAVSISLEVFDARKRLRQDGKETALNVLDSESEVFSARLNQISAEYDSRLAVFRLGQATGMLTPAALGLPPVD